MCINLGHYPSTDDEILLVNTKGLTNSLKQFITFLFRPPFVSDKTRSAEILNIFSDSIHMMLLTISFAWKHSLEIEHFAWLCWIDVIQWCPVTVFIQLTKYEVKPRNPAITVSHYFSPVDRLTKANLRENSTPHNRTLALCMFSSLNNLNST